MTGTGFCGLEDSGEETIYLKKKSRQNAHIALNLGRPWDVAQDSIELPYQFTMEIVEGEAPTFHAWFPGSHLMQTSFVALLEQYGVANLQTFPTHISCDIDDEAHPTYVVSNILGVVPSHRERPTDAGPAFTLYGNYLLEKEVGDLQIFRWGIAGNVVVRESLATVIRNIPDSGLILTPFERM